MITGGGRAVVPPCFQDEEEDVGTRLGIGWSTRAAQKDKTEYEEQVNGTHDQDWWASAHNMIIS